MSYTSRRNLYGKFTQNTSTENLEYGDTLMNEIEKRILNSRAWDFLERVHTDVTVASQQFYDLPVRYKKLIGRPTITVGSQTYQPLEAPNRSAWDRINSTESESDTPQYFFIFNGKIGFYPTPATADNTITLPYEIQAIDLSIADYDTGTITSIANGGTTVEGSGTSWTASMVGRYIRIDDDNTTTSGDNAWYKIASVTDSDTLELDVPYEGASITGATQSYTIAQVSLIPNGYDNLPVYKAAEQYWIDNEDFSKADRFARLYNEGIEIMENERLSKTTSFVVEEDVPILNPNLYIHK